MRTFQRLLLMALAAVIAGAAWTGWEFFQPSHDLEPFSAAAWARSAARDTSNDPGCFRGGMALDLIERRLLLGKSESELVSLVGQPGSRSAGQWVYPLGQCSGFGWYDSELRVSFNANARVNYASFHRTPGNAL